MKKLVQMVAVALMVVGLAGCQNQKKTGARFADRGTRAQQASPRAQAVAPSAVVYGVDANNSWLDHNAWMSLIARLVSPSIPQDYLLDVSQDGTGNTGVFVGARLCTSPAGPLNKNALVVLHVYDSSGIPIPMYLKAVNGYVSNGSFDITFQDQYGSIRLTGSIVNTTSGQKVAGWVVFDTRVRSDGSTDNYGAQLLGQYYMDNVNQLFSCY